MDLIISDGKFAAGSGVSVTGSASLPAAFDVSGLAVASVAAAGNAVAGLVQQLGGTRPDVTVDRGLASLWFDHSFEPAGWGLPPVWDSIAGIYPCADGWIRLHTNAPHHKAAALKVLTLPADTAEREVVAGVVRSWKAHELEAEIVAANGCAAQFRDRQAWLAHPQGAAVAAEPLVVWGEPRPAQRPARRFGHDGGRADSAPADSARADSSRPSGAADAATPERPLAGVRVLDLTRVIAGPVATRFLAGYGATVLRVDPPWWEEPALEPELTVGKTCARLDLGTPPGLARLHELLAGADIVVHGYRADALSRLGLGENALAALYPDLVNVSLNAYGWSGPWANRRGFDSLVQLSCGIAAAGMEHFDAGKPYPLPVQALDHATGYLTAAAVVRAWTMRLRGAVSSAKLSLARTAAELMKSGPSGAADMPHRADYALLDESTAWGAGTRLPAPLTVQGAPMLWDVQARGYGSAPARWVDAES